MSPFELKFSQMILHTGTSNLIHNWSFLFVVLHKPTLLPSTFKCERIQRWMPYLLHRLNPHTSYLLWLRIWQWADHQGICRRRRASAKISYHRTVSVQKINRRAHRIRGYEKESEKNPKCMKKCAFQCFKSMKIGFCEEQNSLKSD